MKLLPRGIRWLPVLVILTPGMIAVSGCGQNDNHPIISSLEAEKDWMAPSSSCEVRCLASDADGDSLTCNWSATGGSFYGAGLNTTWVAPRTPGTYIITAAVTDGRGGEATQQLTLGVRSNYPPIINSLTATPRRVAKTDTSILTCVASDPDKDTLTYLWTATGGNISGSGNTVNWTSPGREGSYAIRVIVTDSLGDANSKELQVLVTCGCGSAE
ncbi:MAG: hypothetical protein PHU08_02055 [Dehalococcoidales bacterium]|nr:hypothetical protein [Dehalococcoidales bacterium]